MGQDVELTFLGTGTSHGVPMIGCSCAVCRSRDPHDQRMRSSVVFKVGTTILLVDTTPELRLQCVNNGVDHIDAVLFTHGHADHIFGFDDTRRFTELRKQPLPCYGMTKTMNTLRHVFAYAIHNDGQSWNLGRPRMIPHEVDGPFEVAGVPVVPIPLLHGKEPVLGFRVGNVAYCTDVSHIPEESYPLLSGLDILVLEALRHTPHPTHFTLDEAIAEAEKIAPKRTYFTHIAHELAHEATQATLPASMFIAYDGLTVHNNR